jgi:ketosteroid isomerase-like protein
MAKLRYFGLIAIVLTSLASQGASAETPREVAEATINKWNEAFRQGRVDEIIALYTDNAMLLAPNGQVSKDPAEIRAFWQALIQRKAGEYSFNVVEARNDKGDTIVSRAILSSIPARASNQPASYHYDKELFNVFKRQKDGSWKTEVQRWN